MDVFIAALIKSIVLPPGVVFFGILAGYLIKKTPQETWQLRHCGNSNIRFSVYITCYCWVARHSNGGLSTSLSG